MTGSGTAGQELVERDAALRALADAAAAAERGSGRAVLVYGEAGIGKTALLRARLGLPTAASASSPVAGWRVLWGGCEALFSPRPLGPLFDMAPALGEPLRALLLSEGRRSELFAALLEQLRTAPGPSALVFEDVHWADAATLDCIKFLGRRLEGTRALLVLSYRDDELGERHPLRAVLGDLPTSSVLRIPLAPLSEAGVAELARRHGVEREGLFAATRGNPFFVTESLLGQGVPSTVRDAVLARAARLPPAVRALLDLVAIVPSRMELSLLQKVAAPSAEDLVTALHSGLLHAEGRWIAFRHELARLAVEQALAAPVAATLHARVLAALESSPDAEVAPARLVHHATATGERTAVQRLAPRAAARAAELGAHREAAALYGTALEASIDAPPIERVRLLEHRSYQCYLVGQIPDAVAAREAALPIWRLLGDRLSEARTLRWLSRLNWFLGRNAEAVALADQAVALLQQQAPGEELAWALSNRAQLHMIASETAQAVELGTRAAELAARLGAVAVEVHALNNTGSALYLEGSPEGRAQLERSLQLALAHDMREHVARAYINLVGAEITRRDYAGARAHIDEASRYLAVRDLDAWGHYVAAWTGRLDMETGNWTAAADGAQHLLSRPQLAPVSRLAALMVLARLRMRRGDPGADEALAEATALSLRTGELQRLGPIAAAHAEAAWLGRHDADVTLAREVLAKARERGAGRAASEIAFWLALYESASPALAADDLQAAPTADDAPAGLVAADDAPAAPSAGADDVPGAPTPAAGAAGVPPVPDPAAALRQASAWAELGCPYEQAICLFRAGDRTGMRAALAQLAALGASATIERLQAEQRREGMRATGVLIRGPRASTAAHPAGLTRREAQILVLVAEGLTNAEIADRLVRSAKTVDHHVSAILGKLNARSRAEASALAVRLGLLDEQGATALRAPGR